MENFDAGFNVTEDFIRCNPVYAAGDRGCPTAFWGIRQDRDAWELEYFYVAEERLGRGLGKQMWEHMIGWCGKQGIGRIQFVTSPRPWDFTGKWARCRTGKHGPLWMAGRFRVLCMTCDIPWENAGKVCCGLEGVQ